MPGAAPSKPKLRDLLQEVLGGSPTSEAKTGPATTGSGAQVIQQDAGAAPRLPVLPVQQGDQIRIAVGEVKTVPMRGVRRIALGNQRLLKATVVDDNQIVLIGEVAGGTTMHIWLRDGRQVAHKLIVDARPLEDRAVDDLLRYVADIPGLKTSMIGGRLLIEGRYQDRETAARVEALADQFPQILNLVAKTPADADPLQLGRMIQLDLQVVEVRKTALEQLGVKWDSSIDGPKFAVNGVGYTNGRWPQQAPDGFPPVNTARAATGYFGLASVLASKINLLEQSGNAWTVAQPRLSARSGGTAKFVAGGEIPIPVAQGNGAISVMYKRYGVLVEFTPRADAAGNVATGVQVEVSEPDSRNANGGYIAFTTNRAETEASIRAGEPLVIAGLLRQLSSRSTDQVPGLGKIPVLGRAFGARDATGEQTELFMIVRPHVLDAERTAQQEDIRRAQDNAFEGAEQLRRNDVHGVPPPDPMLPLRRPNARPDGAPAVAPTDAPPSSPAPAFGPTSGTNRNRDGQSISGGARSTASEPVGAVASLSRQPDRRFSDSDFYILDPR